MSHYRNKIKGLARQDGAVTLVTIIIISVVALIIAVDLAYIGNGEIESGVATEKGSEAVDVAESCASEMLSRFQQDPGYASTSLSLSIGSSSCIISVSATSTYKLIDIKSKVDDFYKKIAVTADISSSSVNIYDWKEY